MFSLLFSLLLACGDNTETTTTADNTPASNEGSSISAIRPVIAASPNADVGVVATWDGGSLEYADGVAQVKGQLMQLESKYLLETYQTAKSSIEQEVMQKILDLEAKAQGVTDADALLKKEIEDKVTKPDPVAIQAMYDQFKSQLQGMPFEQAAPMIEGRLMQQAQQERFMEYIEELKSKYNVKVTLPYPDLPRQAVSADDDPFLGTDGAPVEIIQFAEYQCPYCGRVGDMMDELLEAYPGKIKMVFRDFPLSFHQRAVPAAVAANCAREQGDDKYWAMHKMMMANQTALEDSHLKSYAEQVKLDVAKWEKCLSNPIHEAEVQKDFQDGTEVGVGGTPSFFVNGIMMSGSSVDDFKRLIDKELASK